jgi:hypothetical protein
VVGETARIVPTEPATSVPQENPLDQEAELVKSARAANPQWQGKLLRVAGGQPTERDHDMAVPFAVLNSSERSIELLPPQVQLAGISKNKHLKPIKAEPVGIKNYWITTRKLAPGARADGVVVFERSEPAVMEADNEPDPRFARGPLPEFTTRTKQRTKPGIQRGDFTTVTGSFSCLAASY